MTNNDSRIESAILEGGVREAARQLGISQRSGYKAAESGQLPARRVGRKWIITRRAWDRFLRGDWKPGEVA